MMSNAGCWEPRLAVLALATIWLSGCATGGSEPRIATVCPPVIEYSREFQARAAAELDLLPEGSAIAEMLARAKTQENAARSSRPGKIGYFPARRKHRSLNRLRINHRRLASGGPVPGAISVVIRAEAFEQLRSRYHI